MSESEICNRCGGEIIFRHVSGKVQPIHLNGSCLGISDSALFLRQAIDDFCRRTKCPVCEARVYFVRHNGGSIWFDSLGWPWPKHQCFDKPAEDNGIEGLLKLSAANPAEGRPCLIVHSEYDYRGKRDFLVTMTEARDRETWQIKTQLSPLRGIEGSLGILFEAQKRLVLVGGAEYELEEPGRKCGCGRYFPISHYEEHRLTCMGLLKCPVCQEVLKRKDLPNHLAVHRAKGECSEA